MWRNFFLLAFCWLFVFGSCRKRCVTQNYLFNIGVSATPPTETITLNDTLWFKIDESVVLHDANTNSRINFINADNLTFVFSIRSVISATELHPAADSFNYVVRKGLLVPPLQPDKLRELRLAEEGSRYILEVGFVAKAKGVYRILVGNSANVSRNNSNCEKALFAVKFTNPDQHINLGYGIYGDGVYYFKVN